MKTDSFSNSLRLLCSLLVGAALAVAFRLTARAQVPLDPQLAAMQVEERITYAPVFKDPIVYVGDQPPDPMESQDLWSAIDVMRQIGPGVGIPAMELFVETYPDSGWTPSLRNNLALHYRNKGRYSLALAHWESVWETTKLADSGAAKAVADFALAHYTRLLASLGRKETLTTIFQETQGRVLDASPLQQIFESTREAFGVMRIDPGVAYRCGTLALIRVARILQPGSTNALIPLLVPSPESGFSMSALQDLANQYRLNLVSVQRRSGQALVVPSVVHWGLDHYAAITAYDGKRYRVEDPTFERAIWMDPDTVNAEASGYFLVPANMVLPGWTGLTRVQMDQIFGRGYPYNFDDPSCENCTTDEDGDEADPTNEASNADPGDPDPECPTCNGSGGPGDFDCSNCDSLAGLAMPIWKVTEPHINLWLVDNPMIYTKSWGRRQSFKLIYKQRNSRVNSYGFGFGSLWECNRLAYFYRDSSGNLTHFVPGGGVRVYVDDSPEYKKGLRATVGMDGGGVAVSVSVSFPNAATNKYDYVFSHFDGTGELYLSNQVDRYGHTNYFNYATVSGKVHLVSIKDHDNRLTTFGYGNGSFPDQITVVTNPWGHTVQITYDSSGRLTNIVDAAGIPSSFVYDGSTGWITNLVTPYGTTTFQMTGTTTNVPASDFFSVQRSCIVTEPSGTKQMFVYRWNSSQLNDNDATPLIESDWPTEEVPTLPYSNSLNYVGAHMHNSFRWDRLQYSALNATFKASLNFNDLTVADYNLARLRRWLQSHDYAFLSGTISMQREASPDGVARGQTTWYDYHGKPLGRIEGTNSRPSTIAWVLPDGQTHYKYFEYNEWFRPTLKVESYGDGSTSRTNTLYYYSNGQDLHYETGPNGEILRGYSYNGNHRVLTFTNAVGDVTSYHYDSQNRLDQRILPSSLTNNLTYGGDGFVSQVTDQPINRTRSFTYAKSFVYSRTDERGLAVTNYWDNLQRLTGVLYPDATTVSNIYTILDRTATKDRMTNWTYSGYNAIRQKIAETNANNAITRYGYCDCGALMYMTNAFGSAVQEVTSFAYDYQGNRTFVFYPDRTTVTNWYDSLRRPIATADSIGTRWFGYNNQGLLNVITNAAGIESLTVFDIEDRAYTETDPNGVTVTNTYDNLGRLLTRTYPNTGAEKFGYSARGLTAYTNQLNLVTRYVFDEASRKTAETNANSEVIKYTYTAAGDLSTLTDGKTNVTTWNYDRYGRVTNKVDQASVEILRYKYDANSRLTNRWSYAKGDTKYTYDAVGNLTLVDYPSGTTDITLSYDALNRATNMVDAAGTTKYTYYAGGLLNTEDGPWTSDTVTYTYTNRMRTSLSLQQPTGTWTNGFTWDGAHRLSTASSPAGAFTNNYVGSGRLIQKLALPNSSYITNTYDSVARLTGTYLDNSSNTVLDKSEYLYNLGNQRIRLTRTDGSYYTNTYDNIGQLTWADSTVSTEDRGYLYDTAWNLNHRTNNGVSTTFTVDSKNQLTGGPTGSYAYDGNGNLTSSSSGYVTYTYDAENQLVSWQNYNTAKTDYVYDGRGRLRKRLEYTWMGSPYNQWSSPTETRYVYDGMRVIQERDGSNVPTVSYTRGSDLNGTFEGAGGIGGVLARSHAYQSGSGTFTNHNFYHADGGGNITYMVNSGQSMVATYRYDPYGNTISSSGSLASANVYRFSSKLIHLNSGMYYYGYRFYDPGLQRWLNRDPIGEWGGINLYAFVKNNPPSNTDPFGRATITIPPVIPVIIAGAAGIGLGCLINRVSCNSTRNLAIGLAEAQADANAPDGSTHRGPGATDGNDADLLTHCIATCDLVRHPGQCGGPDGALAAMQRRENLATPGSVIDALNNAVGSGVGISPDNAGQTCTTACLDALNRGLLFTITNGQPAPRPRSPQ